jgi:hypothetical protein
MSAGAARMDPADQFPWTVLGVPPDADAADIRRAYAHRLKQIRPDEDARGFQQLVEARALALQLASDREAPGALDGTSNTRHLGIRLSAPPDRNSDGARTALPPAWFQPPVETSSPQAYRLVHALERVLSSEDLAGWPELVTTASQLTHRQRTALGPHIIDRLSRFAVQEDANRAAWPTCKWPFFALLTAFDEEFGWRENDRAIYEALDEQEAEHFILFLEWAGELSPAGERLLADAQCSDPAQIALLDVHHFYDAGRDRPGLDAYWLVVSDPSLWRPHDAATDLFFPTWSWRDRRYNRVWIGFLGWTGLLLAFAPWRTMAAAWPWPQVSDGVGVCASLLVMGVALWLLMGSNPPPSAHRKTHLVGPLWDSAAFLALPLWALVRRLYVRAAVGAIAWSALAYQLYDFRHDLGLLATIMLVTMLHIAAGEYGQRWVVYKLQRTVAAANKRRILQPTERAAFMRLHGTRNGLLWLQRRDPHKVAKRDNDPPWWWKWVLVFGVLAALLRAIEAFWVRS